VPPYIAVSGNGFTVALDTTLNDELVDEGLAREIINRVQNLRKKSGLAVSDRIRLVVAGAPRVERVMAAHGARITGETLAESVATEAGLPYREEFTVDDVRIVVALAQRSAEPGGES
jgi:isoleucyl-tRNA synthetase